MVVFVVLFHFAMLATVIYKDEEKYSKEESIYDNYFDCDDEQVFLSRRQEQRQAKKAWKKIKRQNKRQQRQNRRRNHIAGKVVLSQRMFI